MTFFNLFRSTMEQFHKSPATYTIHLGNLTACLPEYMRHRRSITIFMCAQKGHNIIFKNQIAKMECFGVGGMKFPAFCLPSIDCSRLCLQQPGVISAQGAWWEQLGLALLGPAQHHSLTFWDCSFPSHFHRSWLPPGSWGCHNLKHS